MICRKTTSVCMDSYATRGRYKIRSRYGSVVQKNCIRCNRVLLCDTRKKYCDNCKVMKHREESKLYQRELRSYIKKSQLAWVKGGI
jgi:hypothetical protein